MFFEDGLSEGWTLEDDPTLVGQGLFWDFVRDHSYSMSESFGIRRSNGTPVTAAVRVERARKSPSRDLGESGISIYRSSERASVW